MDKKLPTDMVKFYADCEERKVKNEQHNYRSYDLSHSIDILNRFVANGYKIRMAWHHFANGKQIKLKAILTQIDGDTSGTYSNLNKLDNNQNQPSK
jgi:hypothetical protein